MKQKDHEYYKEHGKLKLENQDSKDSLAQHESYQKWEDENRQKIEQRK